jgi:nitric oxide reductase NorE protein
LNQNFGAINTLFLLFSSWFVVLSVIDIREHSGKYSAKLFTAAVACGLAFSVVKALEYSEKLSAGIGIITNDFSCITKS